MTETITRRAKIMLYPLILLLMAGGSACSRQRYELLDVTPTPLAAPAGYYIDVAWLERDVLALAYLPTADTELLDERLMIYHPLSGDSELLQDDVPPECRLTAYGRIHRLPNGHLGYLQECLPFKGISRDFRLHEWDQTTQTDREIIRYPLPFWATAFSFAPAMDRWLQEQSGDRLFNRLHYVEPGGTPTRLLADTFARVGWPFWLPDGRILFAGTPQMPNQETNIYSGLPGIAAGLRQPWNIYLTGLDSLLSGNVGEDQIVLPDIRSLSSLKASPDGQTISFLGTIDGNEGLWLYRPESDELARVWAGFGPYDWSPAGDELIVLVREPDAESFRGRPAVVKIPETLSEPNSEVR